MPLDNLVKIGQLKHEPPDQAEFDGMVASAKARLKDAKLEGLSEDSQFSLAYGAAHALALAAMRWHGIPFRQPLSGVPVFGKDRRTRNHKMARFGSMS